MLKPTVEVREENGVQVAEFWDCLRLDMVPVQELRRRFEEHLKRGGRPDLVVDLNGVGFAGSAALGGFVAIHKLCRQADGHMVFCNVDPTVIEVLRVSKLDTLWAVVEDKAAALTVVSNPAPSSTNPKPEAPPRSSAGNSAPPPPLRRRRPPG